MIDLLTAVAQLTEELDDYKVTASRGVPEVLSMERWLPRWREYADQSLNTFAMTEQPRLALYADVERLLEILNADEMTKARLALTQDGRDIYAGAPRPAALWHQPGAVRRAIETRLDMRRAAHSVQGSLTGAFTPPTTDDDDDDDTADASFIGIPPQARMRLHVRACAVATCVAVRVSECVSVCLCVCASC